MKTPRNPLRLGITSCLFITILIVSFMGLAPTSIVSSRASSCSGTGCNGLDPLAAGCTGSVNILASKELKDWNELVLGTMYVVHSTDCDAVYVEVQAWWESSDIFAEITSDGLSYSDSATGLGATSPMIYDPNPSGASGVASINVYTTTVFDCPPYSGECSPSNHYASGNVVAP